MHMDRVEVHIPSNIAFERVARASADEIGKVLDFSQERIEDLKLAVSEAVCNAIEHGNQNLPDKLVMIVFAADHEKLEVHITDQGGGVDADRLDFTPQHIEDEHVDGEGRRGFGMFLISALVDQYEVESSHAGTKFVLRLYRRGSQP